MSKKSEKIREELLNINCLNEENYKELVDTYGSKAVNKAIDDIIDKNLDDSSKYEYYIESVVCADDKVSEISTDLYELYVLEIREIPVMTKAEGDSLFVKVKDVLGQLETLFENVGYYDDSERCLSSNWIDDKVSVSLDICNDKVIIEKINSLYNEFLRLRKLIVEGNLRLVVSVANDFKWNRDSYLDFIQLGNIGLMKAVERYELNNNTKFSTYAYFWIRQSIFCNMPSICLSVSVSRRDYSDLNKLNETITYLSTNLYRMPTDEELAEYLNISVERVVFLKKLEATAVASGSLDAKLCNEDGNDSATFFDIIADDSANVTEEVFSISLKEELLKLFDDCLDDRTKKILCLRMGLYGGKVYKLEEIGEIYGITKERVRQIVNKALKKLRSNSSGLESYLYTR